MRNIFGCFKTPLARGGKIPSIVKANVGKGVRIRVGSPISIGDNIVAASGVVVSANWLGDVVIDTTRG